MAAIHCVNSLIRCALSVHQHYAYIKASTYPAGVPSHEPTPLRYGARQSVTLLVSHPVAPSSECSYNVPPAYAAIVLSNLICDRNRKQGTNATE